MIPADSLHFHSIGCTAAVTSVNKKNPNEWKVHKTGLVTKDLEPATLRSWYLPTLCIFHSIGCTTAVASVQNNPNEWKVHKTVLVTKDLEPATLRSWYLPILCIFTQYDAPQPLHRWKIIRMSEKCIKLFWLPRISNQRPADHDTCRFSAFSLHRMHRSRYIGE